MSGGRSLTGAAARLAGRRAEVWAAAWLMLKGYRILGFRLRTPQGGEPIPSVELLQTRDISYNETQALAKEAEEALLYRNMQSDIVQQMLRRLAAVKQL